MNRSNSSFKHRAHALVESLPRDAGWSELLDRVMARQDVEETGLNGESASVAEEVMEEYQRMQAEVARSRKPGGDEGW